jgi:hypothetical protein
MIQIPSTRRSISIEYKELFSLILLKKKKLVCVAFQLNVECIFYLIQKHKGACQLEVKNQMMYRRSHAPLSATKTFLSEDMLEFGILLYSACVNIGVPLGDNDYEIDLINIDQ